MKILVCIKEVVDPESPLTLGEHGSLDLEQNITFRMNRYDEFALEEAVQIKEKFSDVTIHALCLGPERAKAVLKKALGKGADDAYLLLHETSETLLSMETANHLASFAREGNYDMITTGVMSEDLMQCSTGPLMAALLGLPCGVAVIHEELDKDSGHVTIESEIEGGIKEKARLDLPCLLTVQSGINRPRYPSLSNVLRAKQQVIHEIQVTPLQEKEKHSCAQSLSYPVRTGTGTLLSGTAEEKAAALADALHERGLL